MVERPANHFLWLLSTQFLESRVIILLAIRQKHFQHSTFVLKQRQVFDVQALHQADTSLKTLCSHISRSYHLSFQTHQT